MATNSCPRGLMKGFHVSASRVIQGHHGPLVYMSAMETFICHSEIEFEKVYFLWFCTSYDPWFSKYCTELIVASSFTNATMANFLVQIKLIAAT